MIVRMIAPAAPRPVSRSQCEVTESSARAELDLSVVLPTLNERENLEELIPQLQDSISRLGVRFEIVVVDSCSADGTAAAASRLGATVIERPARYGEALLAGFAAARGAYILTMDADHSHDPAMIAELWAHRAETRIAIASRYVRRGSAKMPVFRSESTRGSPRADFRYGRQPSRGTSSEIPSPSTMTSSNIVPSTRLR